MLHKFSIAVVTTGALLYSSFGLSTAWARVDQGQAHQGARVGARHAGKSRFHRSSVRRHVAHRMHTDARHFHKKSIVHSRRKISGAQRRFHSTRLGIHKAIGKRLISRSKDKDDLRKRMMAGKGAQGNGNQGKNRPIAGAGAMKNGGSGVNNGGLAGNNSNKQTGVMNVGMNKQTAKGKPRIKRNTMRNKGKRKLNRSSRNRGRNTHEFRLTAMKRGSRHQINHIYRSLRTAENTARHLRHRGYLVHIHKVR